MAIVDFPIFQYPGLGPRSNNRNIGFGSLLIDAAGEKAAGLFQVPKTGTISHLHFRVNAVTTSGNADVRLETVDADTGNPTGTLVSAGANATLAIATANKWERVALTTPAAVTRSGLMSGVLALVVARSTGNYSITTGDPIALGQAFPYASHFTSSWAKNAATLVMMVEYNDGTFPVLPGILPISAITNLTVSFNSEPDELGAVFTAPTPAIRVTGVATYVNLNANTDLRLLDASDTILASVTTASDTDLRNNAAGGTFYWRFDQEVTLTPGDTYRLIYAPQAANITVPAFNVDQAAYLAAFPGGTSWIYTSRVDNGTWANIDTRVANIELLVNGIDSGGSGIARLVGGGLVR